MKATLVMSILFGGLIAFAFTAIIQPNYIKGLTQSTEIIIKAMEGKR